MCRECAVRALEDVKKFLLIEGGQVAVSYCTVYMYADPENLHGRWLTGWLPIVNHTGAKGVAG